MRYAGKTMSGFVVVTSDDSPAIRRVVVVVPLDDDAPPVVVDDDTGAERWPTGPEWSAAMRAWDAALDEDARGWAPVVDSTPRAREAARRALATMGGAHIRRAEAARKGVRRVARR